MNLPVVLGKERVFIGAELKPQRTKGLRETRVAGFPGTGVRFVQIGEVVQQTAVAEAAKLGAQVLGKIMDMPCVNAKLEGMFAMRHGYRVCELKTGLIGKLCTHQEGRSAKAESIGDRNIRR